jgi:radical SAM protein with 4Fe4S-binding SPASM domain
MYSLGYAGKMRIIFGPVSAPLELAQKLHIACPQTANMDLLSLTLYAANKGFVPDLRPELKICGMLLPHHLVVDPDGKLYTCPTFLGMDEYQTGSIEGDNAGIRKLTSFALKEECLKCLYAPFCTGGCRYNAHVEQGDIRAIDCQKETFSYSIPHLLKAHHAMRNKNVQSSDSTEDYLIPEGTSFRNRPGDIIGDRDHGAISQKVQEGY